MINKINFCGRACFLDRILKTIKPQEQKRIEQYAAKKPDDIDVFVYSKKHEDILMLDKKAYTQDKYKLNLDGEFKYIVKKDDGSIEEIPTCEANIVKKPLPVYQALLIDENGVIDKKEFDFSEDKEQNSVFLGCDGHTYSDIEY